MTSFLIISLTTGESKPFCSKRVQEFVSPEFCALPAETLVTEWPTVLPDLKTCD